jgi:type I site-specific restriction-modification system R (restriction) subunit
VPTARIIHDSLPNATFIGFTGTPIDEGDRSTREVFGDYIDIYDMTQAVEDGATRPVYYESRVVHLRLNDDALAKIDAEYKRLAEEEEADVDVIEQSKRDQSQMEVLLGHDDTVKSLVDDILAEGKKLKVEPKDEAELEKTLPYLRLQLKALIARDLWDMSEYFSVFNERSEIVKKALEVIQQ